MQELQDMQVQPLGRENPLEKEMATYSSILPGESHGQGSLEGHSPRGHKESDTTWQLSAAARNSHILLFYIVFLILFSWMRKLEQRCLQLAAVM